MINTSAKGLIAMAVAVVGISVSQGIKVDRMLQEKALAQTDVTDSVRRWKQSYQSLGESVKKWERDYRDQDTVDDLMSMFSAMNLAEAGLSANIDSLSLSKIEPVTPGDISIGLTKYCVSSGSGVDASTIEVKAADYQTLFTGIKRLANRPDIYIGTISVKGDKPEPVATLGEFCVLLSK